MIKPYQINDLLIPRTWIGWGTFAILAMLGLILAQEGFSYMKSHLDKSSWIATRAAIIDLEIQEDHRAFTLKYAYSVDAVAYQGKLIGLKMKTRQSASPKLLSKLREYQDNGIAITIRFNPTNPGESYFDVTPNDIFYVTFLLAVPILLFLLFLVALFMELNQYLRSRDLLKNKEREDKGGGSN